MRRAVVVPAARVPARGYILWEYKASEPQAAGATTIAVFEDTCGNLIQIYQPVD